MARARKSHDSGKEEVKSRTKLPPAFAAKVGGNKFVVYADLHREGDPYARVLVTMFAAEYAARTFIDLLIHNDEWEWVDPIGSRQCIRTTGGVRISMFNDTLKELLQYKMSDEEQAWGQSIHAEETKKQVLRFKYGIHEGVKSRDYDNEEQSDGAAETLGNHTEKRRKAKRSEPRAPKEPKVKVDKSGYVSANQIAAQHKLEGREIRGILRASDLKKPDIGWMWPKDSDELKQARKVIEAGMKALAKKKGKK